MEGCDGRNLLVMRCVCFRAGFILTSAGRGMRHERGCIRMESGIHVLLPAMIVAVALKNFS